MDVCLLYKWKWLSIPIKSIRSKAKEFYDELKEAESDDEGKIV